MAQAPQLSLIPKPSSITPGRSVFRLENKVVVHSTPGTALEAEYLAAALAPAMGRTIPVQESLSTAPLQHAITFVLDPAAGHLGAEGYRLVVETDSVNVAAWRPAGLFYACQTIRQLLPPQIFASRKQKDIDWTIPCLTVEDRPRFGHRGLLLDVCRHFFTVEELKHTIDLMALHKLNRFHLHLTDDQGWRLEIQRYPPLTEIGAWRAEADGTRYGGFYTQEQMREVIAYAAERHITIIPEIEMPSHSMAALTSYPFLGCTGGPYTVQNGWGIFPDVLCAGKESTFQFIENVLDEVMQLFPSQFIHIGGDECRKERWSACPLCQSRKQQNQLKDEHELQSYFIRRVDAYLSARGRRLIGWDEILEGGLASGAIVQSWRGTQGGITAASEGHDVIMSPNTHCYLDYSYEKISVETAFGFEPIPPELSPDKAKHILGLEGTMWTEHVKDQARSDFMVYPRMTALAEVAWSPGGARSYEDFKSRLEAHLKRFSAMRVTPGPHQ